MRHIPSVIITFLLFLIAVGLEIHIYMREVSSASIVLVTIIYIALVYTGVTLFSVRASLVVVVLAILSNLLVLHSLYSYKTWDIRIISLIILQVIIFSGMYVFKGRIITLLNEVKKLRRDVEKSNMEALSHYNSMQEYKKGLREREASIDIEGINYYTRILKTSQFARDISSTFDIEEIIDTIIKGTRSLLRAKASSLFMPSDGSIYFKCVKAASLEGENNVEDIILQPGQGLLGWVLENKKFVNRNSALRDVKLKEMMLNDPFRFEIASPLLYQERITGLLIIHKISPLPANDSEWQSIFGLTSIITNLAAISLENAKNFEKAQILATIDGLTKLYNHRFFQDLLKKQLKEAQRTKSNISVVMADIDFFKKFNDTYGHQIGDKALRRTAQLIKDNLRPMDFAARYGGEEFAVILPDADAASAFQVADRIKRILSDKPFECDGKYLHITLSMGIATYPQHGNNSFELIKSADKALYQAKEEGRNRIILFK